MYRGILLLGLVILSLAQSAKGNEDEIIVVRPHRVGLADDANGQSASPRVEQDRPVYPAQYIAKQPYPGEPLGFSAAKLEPGTAVDPGLQSPAFDPQQSTFFEEQLHDGPALDLDAPAPIASSGEWLRKGHSYSQQSVAYMTRAVSVKNQITLSSDFSSATLFKFRNTLEIIDDNFQPGVRSTFGTFLGRDESNRDHAVEFTFLGLLQWHASGGIVAVTPGNIVSSLDTDTNFAFRPFDLASSQSYTESSRFNSYETNYRIAWRLSHDQMVYTRDGTWVRQAVPAMLPALFAGMRVVTVNERLGYFTHADATTTLPALNGSYLVATHNTLVGPQIGAECFYERGLWRFGARTKTAALVNWADQSTQVQITDVNGNLVPNLQNRQVHQVADIMSFVGEINTIGMYQLTKHFALRFSYDLMWVTDLALAQNQVSFKVTDPPFISAQHSLFFQGVSFGFEFLR